MKYGTEVPLGDGPCTDCGNDNPFVWRTDNVFWNEVCRFTDEPEPMLCPPCFVRRVFERGFRPVAFRIIPDWPWVEPIVSLPQDWVDSIHARTTPPDAQQGEKAHEVG